MTSNRSSTLVDDPAIGVESSGGTGSQDPLAEAGEEAGQTAGMLAERATSIGFEQADKGRQQAADGLEHLSDSIRRVSLDMEGEQPAIANVASTAAEQAERVAEYLRNTDARQLLSTLEDVARRQPLIFLGGAFALGMAASRFIKAAGGPSGGRGAQQSPNAYGTQRSAGAWTSRDTRYEATGPGGAGTNGLTADDGRSEGI